MLKTELCANWGWGRSKPNLNFLLFLPGPALLEVAWPRGVNVPLSLTHSLTHTCIEFLSPCHCVMGPKQDFWQYQYQYQCRIFAKPGLFFIFSLHADLHVMRSLHADLHVMRSLHADLHAMRSLHADLHAMRLLHADLHAMVSLHAELHAMMSLHAEQVRPLSLTN